MCMTQHTWTAHVREAAQWTAHVREAANVDMQPPPKVLAGRLARPPWVPKKKKGTK